MQITVITPPGRDKLGNPDGAETTRTVQVVGIAPTRQGSRSATSEVEDRNREGLIESCTVYLASATEVIANTDKVLIPGDTVRWDVSGAPQSWTHPQAPAHGGGVLELKRRRG